MRRFALLTLALALCACTTAQNATVHQDAEKAVISADYLYVALAAFANQQEASGQWTLAKGETLKTQAYAALLQVRALYAAGKAVDLSTLNAMAAQNGVPSTAGGS